jgi:hypothetical protein
MDTGWSLRAAVDRRPLAREAMVATAALGAFGLWIDLVGWATRRYVPLGALDIPGGANAGLALTGFLVSVVLLAGMALFVATFARLRGAECTPALPGRRALGAGAGAVGAGVVLAGTVRLAGALSGESLSSATGITHGPGASVGIVALVTALGLFVGIPAYLVVTHVLVQNSLRRASTPRTAVAATALAVGVLGPTAVLDVTAVRATVGASLAVIAIALPVVAAERYGRRWLTALTALPLLLLAAGVGAERLAAVDGPASAAYLCAEILVVGVGAAAHERTDSTLPSALAYASFVVAAEAFVFVAQVGVPW